MILAFPYFIAGIWWGEIYDVMLSAFSSQWHLQCDLYLCCDVSVCAERWDSPCREQLSRAEIEPVWTCTVCGCALCWGKKIDKTSSQVSRVKNISMYTHGFGYLPICERVHVRAEGMNELPNWFMLCINVAVWILIEVERRSVLQLWDRERKTQLVS